MATRKVEAVLSEEGVAVPLREDADMLIQSGYGTLDKDKGAVLSRCEALYLLAEDRISVVEGAEKVEVAFRPLLERLRAEDPEIWIRYLIFRDLRSRGYVAKEGFGWGIDFRVYERGTYRKKAAKYVVYAICEGSPMPTRRLEEVLRLVHGTKKELIVAVVDRRGEIVYYSLARFNLDLRSKSGE